MGFFAGLACENFCSDIFLYFKKFNQKSKWSVQNELSYERSKNLQAKKVLSQKWNPKLKMKSRNQWPKKPNLILKNQMKKHRKMLLQQKSLRKQNLMMLAKMKKTKKPKCLLMIPNRKILNRTNPKRTKPNRNRKKNGVRIWLNFGRPSKTIHKISPVGLIFYNLWTLLETLTMVAKRMMLFFTDILIVMDIGKNMLIWKNVKVLIRSVHPEQCFLN